MPNHVRNVIKMDSIGLSTFIQKDKNGNKFIDFNKIIPMPEDLSLDSGSIGELSMETVARIFLKDEGIFSFAENHFRKTMSDESYVLKVQRSGKSELELANLGLAYISNKIKYGATSWYDWRIQNWGTKWNAYDCVIEENCLKLSTAWSEPEPIIKKISEMVPNAKLEHWWADEDTGNNTGHRILLAGKEIGDSQGEYIDNSQDAYECYMFCWDTKKCFHKDENGIWKMNYCETCNGCD